MTTLNDVTIELGRVSGKSSDYIHGWFSKNKMKAPNNLNEIIKFLEFHNVDDDCKELFKIFKQADQ